MGVIAADGVVAAVAVFMFMSVSSLYRAEFHGHKIDVANLAIDKAKEDAANKLKGLFGGH